MKILVLYSIFLVTTVHGQEINTRKLRAYCRKSARNNKKHLTISLGESFLFCPQSNDGQLAVSFPYLTTTNSGATPHIFNSNVTNPFSKPFGTFGLDIQMGSKNHFFDVEIGGGSGLDFYFSLGYGREISGQKSIEKGLRIKPSINVGFYEFVSAIGSIDNQGKIINVLSEKIDSTFFTKVSARGQWKTYNASYVNVQYVQHDFLVNPKIAFEYHPFKNLFFIEFSLSYFLPFSEIAKIRFEQTDGGQAKKIADSFSLDTKDLVTTFNTKPVANTPFTFTGLQIGLKIGF